MAVCARACACQTGSVILFKVVMCSVSVVISFHPRAHVHTHVLMHTHPLTLPHVTMRTRSHTHTQVEEEKEEEERATPSIAELIYGTGKTLPYLQQNLHKPCRWRRRWKRRSGRPPASPTTPPLLRPMRLLRPRYTLLAPSPSALLRLHPALLLEALPMGLQQLHTPLAPLPMGRLRLHLARRLASPLRTPRLALKRRGSRVLQRR